jgi:hypothetical protein
LICAQVGVEPAFVVAEGVQVGIAVAAGADVVVVAASAVAFAAGQRIVAVAADELELDDPSNCGAWSCCHYYLGHAKEHLTW